MGEIFSRAVPSKALPFTGERLTTDYTGQTEIEHLHRYMLAREYCRGRDVLDVAAGEGYGSALIAQVANFVVGVEVAEDAVAHAAENYSGECLQFLKGDARALPIGDATVDVVVSFETIEHFDQQDKFLSEVKRVLRPGGIFIVSTPDRDNYSPVDHPANPYHISELTQREFATLLRHQFENVAMWWQRPMLGSVLMPGPDASVAQNTFCFERRGTKHFEVSRGYARPLYLIALCSDEQPPPLPPSIYIESSQLHRFLAAEGEMNLKVEENAKLNAMLSDAEEQAKEAGERLRQHVLDSEEQAKKAEERAKEAEQRLRQHVLDTEQLVKEIALLSRDFHILERTYETLVHDYEALETRYQQVVSSTTWKVTYPARWILSKSNLSRRFIRRSAKLSWWLVTGQLARRLELRRQVLNHAKSKG